MLAAGGRIATGRTSNVGQVKGDDPDREGRRGPPGWGLGREANNLTSVKRKFIVEKLNNRSLTDNIGKTPRKSCKDRCFWTASCTVLGLFGAAVLQWVKQTTGKTWNCSIQGNKN